MEPTKWPLRDVSEGRIEYHSLCALVAKKFSFCYKYSQLFFWLRVRRAYDCAYDSDSVTSEDQPLASICHDAPFLNTTVTCPRELSIKGDFALPGRILLAENYFTDFFLPIRANSRTNNDSVTRFFPRFAPAASDWFIRFSLVRLAKVNCKRCSLRFLFEKF